MHWFIPQMSTQLEMGHTKAGSQEGGGAQSPEPSLLLPGAVPAGSQSKLLGLGIEPRSSDVGCGYLYLNLNC